MTAPDDWDILADSGRLAATHHQVAPELRSATRDVAARAQSTPYGRMFLDELADRWDERAATLHQQAGAPTEPIAAVATLRTCADDLRRTCGDEASAQL